MTILKLSIAACAALIVGAWAESAKAHVATIVSEQSAPFASLSSTAR
jgi:hypothetical protein